MSFADVTPDTLDPSEYPGEQLFDAVTLASSNALRKFLGIPAAGLVRSAIPKFATRADPSVDNYLTDLLLRSVYGCTTYVPQYEEYVIRGHGSAEETADLNPGLTGATVLGIGAHLDRTQFIDVYDEHNEDGSRIARAACETVHLRHLTPTLSSLPEGYLEVFEEVCESDSKGSRSGFQHLYPITKSLHTARLKLPRHASERFPARWKRAIVEAALVSVMLTHDALTQIDRLELRRMMDGFWEEEYLPRMRIGIHQRYFKGRSPDLVTDVEAMVIRERSGGDSAFLTMERIVPALQRTWQPEVANFLASLLMEGAVQAQGTFRWMQDLCEGVWQSPRQYDKFGRLGFYPISGLPGDEAYHHVVIYEMQPQDSLPHRGIQYWLGRHHLKGVLVIRNRQTQTTAIFRVGRYDASQQKDSRLEPAVWEAFTTRLQEREPQGRWYQPVQGNGERAAFILNGTESRQTSLPTLLQNRDIMGLFGDCIRQYIGSRRLRNH